MRLGKTILTSSTGERGFYHLILGNGEGAAFLTGAQSAFGRDGRRGWSGTHTHQRAKKGMGRAWTPPTRFWRPAGGPTPAPPNCLAASKIRLGRAAADVSVWIWGSTLYRHPRLENEPRQNVGQAVSVRPAHPHDQRKTVNHRPL